MARRIRNAGELDLVPILNLMTLLIPFLLVASSFASLATLEPRVEEVRTGELPPGALGLAIAVTDEGWTVLGADEALVGQDDGRGPTIPCLRPGCPTADDYDAAELSRLLAAVKARHPREHQVVVLPEPQIPYDVLVRTMDASRELTGEGGPRTLFPTVVIAAEGP